MSGTGDYERKLIETIPARRAHPCREPEAPGVIQRTTKSLENVGGI